MKTLTIVEKESKKDDLSYWQKKSASDRLSAVEFLREQFYIIQGYQTTPTIIYAINLIDPD